MRFKNRTLYIPAPPKTNMTNNHKKLVKKETCEQTPARVPVNHGSMIGTCVECDCIVTQHINITGTDGGSTKLCYPCFADWFDDDHIPYDDHIDIVLPHTPEQILKYDLKPHGIKETLVCGCILIDMNNGEKLIHMCDLHRYTITPKVIMADLEMTSCTGCDKMFPEYELTLCRVRKNMETICLCPQCFAESPYGVYYQ